MKQRIEDFDLRPNIEFVVENIKLYDNAMAELFDKVVLPHNLNDGEIKFEDLEERTRLQVDPGEINYIVSIMPQALQDLSVLKIVRFYGKVLVPEMDEEGYWTGIPEAVAPDEFPREGDHPSAILVGVSNEHVITPTPIPPSVHDNAKAVHHYQIHVFLHEYFHTIENTRRSPEKRSSVLLETDGDKFTLQDLWRDFESVTLRSDWKPVSMYASVYTPALNEETRDKDYETFQHAIGEQIAESFAGYLLNIVSNHHGCVDFEAGHPQEWNLIDRLYRAEVLKK